MSGSKWFSCLWRGGVCVCVCVHLPHAAKQCTALSHSPLLQWASRSATGGNWVLSGPFLSLCTAPGERTAQSPGPQQSCFGSYDVSFSSLFSRGFWFVNCLLQMSPMAQAAATNVSASVSSGQMLPPWITLPPVELRQGFGARLPGRHHAGQNKGQILIHKVRSAPSSTESAGDYCHGYRWARGCGMGLRWVKHQKSCGSYWDSAVFLSKCFYGACNL